MAIQELAIVREELNAREKQINELKEKCWSYEEQTNELAKIDDHEGELIKQSGYLFHAPHYS